MCGIVAVVALEALPSRAVGSADYRLRLASSLNESLDLIKHRGPDDRGQWISPHNRIGLGHVRLSINDLSPAGHQPFCHESDGVYVVVNGELYGHESIREELRKDFQFTSTSDSEIIIALYLKFGTLFLSKLRGEFAFVLYDSKRQLVFAARDRYGVKPLYWTVNDDRLLIASEMKAFLPLGWKAEWDVRSLAESGWLYDQRTIFKRVSKIPAGHYLTCSSYYHTQIRQYWEVDYPDKRVPEVRSEQYLIQELREQLVNAVRIRMRADVPVGIYLSGGIDSAAIAGIAADIHKKLESNFNDGQRPRKPECFVIGFEGKEFDESEIAQGTAKFCGLDLHTKRVTDEMLAEGFASATFHNEHHNTDLNFIAKYVLSTLPPQHGFKVVLTGEGSDEIFGGYPIFHSNILSEPDLTWPDSRTSEEQRIEILGRLDDALSRAYRANEDNKTGVPVAQEYSQLPNESIMSPLLFKITLAHFAPWVAGYGKLSLRETYANTASGRILELMDKKWHSLHATHYIWIKSILSNYNLTSLGDRMEMAHSVEGRPPFLDHVFTEFANGLPPSLKVRVEPDSGELVEKWILREAAKPYITRDMYRRKKHPFSAPIKYPRNGPIHRLLMSLLTRDNIEQLGFLDCDKTLDMLEQAFDESVEDPSLNTAAIRYAFVAAQWVVLSQRFQVATATPIHTI